MKYWWMFDNHTFQDLGTDLDGALAGALLCFQIDAYGSLFAHDENGNAIGISVHGHGAAKESEFRAALAAFKEDVAGRQSYQI
jgi:hypothetical protein